MNRLGNAAGHMSAAQKPFVFLRTANNREGDNGPPGTIPGRRKDPGMQLAAEVRGSSAKHG